MFKMEEYVCDSEGNGCRLIKGDIVLIKLGVEPEVAMYQGFSYNEQSGSCSFHLLKPNGTISHVNIGRKASQLQLLVKPSIDNSLYYKTMFSHLSKGIKLPILFHYCSFERLIMILRSKTLWLSDLTKSNDPKEWIMEQDAVLKQILDAALAFNEDVAYHNSKQHVDGASLEAKCKTAFENAHIYGLCMSPDSDLLSQWRAYGDDGKGVSIAIDPSTFYKHHRFIKEVQYCSPDECAKDISYYSFSNPSDKDDFIEKAIDLYTAYALRAAITKDRFYVEEQERRLILMDGLKCDEVLADADTICKLEEDFRCKLCEATDSTPRHYELHFNDFTSVIKSITLGPCCQLSVKEVKKLLRVFSTPKHPLHKIEVEKSQGFYRNR